MGMLTEAAVGHFGHWKLGWSKQPLSLHSVQLLDENELAVF